MLTIAYIPRIIFRILAYPLLAYFITIYYHAKCNDLDDSKGLAGAFVLPEFLSNYTEDPTQAATTKKTAKSREKQVVQLDPEIQIDDLVSSPKEKEFKTVPQGIEQDLSEQKKLLHELAIQCQILEATKSTKSPQLIHPFKCYHKYPYHERIQNEIMANYGKIFNVMILKAAKIIDNSLKDLAANQISDGLYYRIMNFSKFCGQGCRALAQTLNQDYRIDGNIEFREIKRKFKAVIEDLEGVLMPKLEENNSNISPRQQVLSKDEHHDDTLPDETEESDLVAINNLALNQLNANFTKLKECNVITKDIIDKEALLNLTENVDNIKF